MERAGRKERGGGMKGERVKEQERGGGGMEGEREGEGRK